MKPPVTHIDLGIKGACLKVAAVNDLLGIAATSGFDPYESYIGRSMGGDGLVLVEQRRPSFGVWHFSTESMVTSGLLEDHARYLLSSIATAKPTLKQLLVAGDYEIIISMWHVGPSGFVISSPVLAELATYSNCISVVCFETTESFSENEQGVMIPSAVGPVPPATP